MTVSPVHRLLEASADHRPEAEALIDRDRPLTYGELEAWANRVARTLLDLGVTRGDRVGLYLDKSAAAVVGAYGIMKSGAAYVPMDPAAPVARLGSIAADAGMRVLVTGREKSERWRGLQAGGAVLESLVVLDAGAAPSSDGLRVIGAGDVAARPDARLDVAVDVDDLAYILYTSGSTGVPKGVMLSHRNARTFIDWAAGSVGVGPADRLSSHAPLHFDLSIFDLYAAAHGGASVTMVPPEASVLPRELRRFIEEAGISVWYSVPSILTSLTLHGGLEEGDLPGLRAVIFAGEVFPTRFLRRLMELLPHAAFYNWYGPTETNVCTWYRVSAIPEDRDEPVPIGRPIPGTRVFAVTEGGLRAGPGEVGELHVRGPGVMRGYWGDPERTARAMVPDPLDPGAPEPAYRTGDLARELEDGNFRFLGRRDAQIKSRGYRIELGEVEATLLAHPRVVECAVVAVPDEEVTNRLLAHVVVEGVVGADELSSHCRAHLPKYMIPEAFEFKEALPKTSTGKIDRQALIRT